MDIFYNCTISTCIKDMIKLHLKVPVCNAFHGVFYTCCNTSIPPLFLKSGYMKRVLKRALETFKHIVYVRTQP